MAVFSSDGLSSVAYATEEILYVLMAAGTAASVYSLPIGLAIIGLVLVVAASYTQTIQAYPSGGGSYVVSRKNLGELAGLTAGAALLIDYILTVAVSATAGIHAVVSAVPELRGHEVGLTLCVIWLITWINLRGTRESGFIFAIPTYAFLVTIFLLLAAGAYQILTGGWHPALDPAAGFGLAPSAAAEGVTWFLLLRAFSSGCTALSGLEAVSNGVQAFQEPQAGNAIRVMRIERTLLYLMFGGITLLAFHFNVLPREGETVLSQIGRSIFGGGPLYYAVQAATALILLLAANTAFADFPRLVGMIARDGFLPRRLANRGDTLVFHHGIVLLAGLASFLVVIFHGSTHALIPLYAVGVFTAFTLSQSGMVVHWLRKAAAEGRSKWHHWKPILLNGTGALLCGCVLLVVAVTKFTHGAWMVMILIPGVVLYFRHVNHYYVRFSNRIRALSTEFLTIDRGRKIKAVLAVGALTPVIDHSLWVARRLTDDIRAVHVAIDPEEGARLHDKWSVSRYGAPLVVIPSPYRDVVAPLRTYLDRLLRVSPGSVIHLLVPIVVTNEPFRNYLHNGTADQMIRELRYTDGIVITEIPFYVEMNRDEGRVIARWREPV